MYGHLKHSATAAGGTLPFTGLAGMSLVWMLITAIILLAAGVTILSLIPKQER